MISFVVCGTKVDTQTIQSNLNEFVTNSNNSFLNFSLFTLIRLLLGFLFAYISFYFFKKYDFFNSLSTIILLLTMICIVFSLIPHFLVKRFSKNWYYILIDVICSLVYVVHGCYLFTFIVEGSPSNGLLALLVLSVYVIPIITGIIMFIINCAVDLTFSDIYQMIFPSKSK